MLSQVIAGLEKDPTRLYEGVYGIIRHTFSVSNGYFLFLKYDMKTGKMIPYKDPTDGDFNNSIHISKIDWKLIKKYVPWEESLFAWVKECDTIVVEMDGKTYRYRGSLFPKNLGQVSIPIRRMFYEGKWFINEEEEE